MTKHGPARVAEAQHAALLCKLANAWRFMTPDVRRRLPRDIETLLEDAHSMTRGDARRCMCIDGKRDGVHAFSCPARS